MKIGGKLITSDTVAYADIVTLKVLSVDADREVSSITKVTVWMPKSASESVTIDIVAY